MDTYTMTFVDQEMLGLPPDATHHKSEVRDIVAEKFREREFMLADFNWDGYYDPQHSWAYLYDPYHYKAVVEIRLALDINALSSREAIYEKCLAALKMGELVVATTEIMENHQPPHSLIRFAMSA